MIDSFADRKIFLLIAQPDDFPEISSDERSRDLESSRRNFVSKSTSESLELNLKESESEPETRQFGLYEIGVEYSTDSGPESDSDEDSSRPPSRLGFAGTKRIVYDSGRTSREDGASTGLSLGSPGPIRTSSDSLDKITTETSRPYSRETIEDDAEVRQVFAEAKKRSQMRRKSENLLLSRRNSLRFIVENNDPVFRSRSLMDLQRSCRSAMEKCSTRLPISYSSCENVLDNVKPLRTNSDLSEIVPGASRIGITRSSCDGVEDLNRDTDCSSYERVLDGAELPRNVTNLSEVVRIEENRENERRIEANSMEDLLRDYERSKRGFRTNPFLQEREDEAERIVEHRPLVQNLDTQGKNDTGRDSEAHRRAWAEILSDVLERALALPVIIYLLI